MRCRKGFGGLCTPSNGLFTVSFSYETQADIQSQFCILHGRPVSISRADIDVDTPVDMEDLQPKERINTFQNSMAMLKLTIFMEDVRDAM